MEVGKTQSLETRLMELTIFFLSVLTVVYSLRFAQKSLIFLFVSLFLGLRWQRERLQPLVGRYFHLPPSPLLYLGIGLCWGWWFQLSLGTTGFIQKPVLTLLFSLGLYLPYFAIWYRIFKFGDLDFFETFFLSGLSAVAFQSFISKKLINTVVFAPNLFSGLIFFLLKTAATLVLIGALTSVPYLLLTQSDPNPALTNKKKTYLLGLASFSITIVVFLVWSAVLKKIILKIYL